MTTNGPFHTVTNKDVYDKLESLDDSVKRAVTKMEAQDEKVGENAARIKSLEIKVYGVAAGLIAAVTILVAGA